MKLYLVVLDALMAGERIAQAAHAVTEMALAHPVAFRAWHDGTNTVVCLAMDARGLFEVLHAATMHGDPVAEFCEPDRGGELTAVALFPSHAAVRRLLRRAPLASASEAQRSSGLL